MNSDEHLTSSRPANLFMTGLFLGVATFVMSVSLITVANTGSSLFGETIGTRIYNFCIVAWTMGFLVYSLVDRLVAMAAVRRAILVLATGICAFAFSNVVFVFSKNTYVLYSLLCLFLFGVLYAGVYHKTAVRMAGSPYTGRLVGLSVAGIELAIWPVVSLIENAFVTFITVSAAAVLICCYLCSRPTSEGRRKGGPPEQAGPGATVIALVLTTVLIGVMVSMTENIFLSHIAKGNIKMQDWPRLIHAVSILALGFLADVKKRRYLPLTTFCVMMLFSIGIILWEDNNPIFIAMCVYYIFRAAGIIFFTVSFLDIAPKTKNPGLWSVMGRMSHALTEAALLFTLSFFELKLLGMIVISLLSTMLLFLIMLRSRLFVPSVPHPVSVSAPVPEAPKLEELIKGYGLTSRETEVLRCLLDGDQTGQIAAKMRIKENTVYKYISSMMSKTGAKSRGAIIAMFANPSP